MDVEDAALARGVLGERAKRIDHARGNRSRGQKRGATADVETGQSHDDLRASNEDFQRKAEYRPNVTTDTGVSHFLICGNEKAALADADLTRKSAYSLVHGQRLGDNRPRPALAGRKKTSVDARSGRPSVVFPTLLNLVIPGPAQQEPGISQPSSLDSGFAPSGAPRNDGGYEASEIQHYVSADTAR